MNYQGYLLQKPDGCFIPFFNYHDWIDACADYEAEGYEILVLSSTLRQILDLS